MNWSEMSGVRTTIGIGASASLLALAAGVSPALATGASRPASEHVPASVHKVEVLFQGTGQATARWKRGAKAAQLVELFNKLKREPRDTVHCDVAGGPQTTVTFKGAKHTWVATQSACTNVVVTRDGKGQPTLLPSKKWEAAISHDIGR